MWQLFRVDTTPQETIDYWNEQNRRFEVYYLLIYDRMSSYQVCNGCEIGQKRAYNVGKKIRFRDKMQLLGRCKKMSWLEDITSSIKYIEEHLTDELSLERIAAKINLSPFYFQKRIFYSLWNHSIGIHKEQKIITCGQRFANRWC